jgi:Tol biopolymer transport system component/predicted Ser/Thr protein kinase
MMTIGGSLPGGTRLGRYEIVSLLAAGGMGEVYIARDTNLGRRVALKVLPPELTADSERIARFVREAEASSALNHPAIVTVHDAGAAEGVQYLAMELIDGEPLSAWMRAHRDTRRALELMAQVAEALAAAHAHGIVHRDLKPANIVVGRGGWAKVVDFGVAKLTERVNGKPNGGDTAPAAVIGTAAYMAPEQIEGRAVDHRADVYAFGVVLHELLTGRHPIDNVTQRTLDGLPRDLQRIVRRCLAKDPELRYQSMKDLALDLREASLDEERSTPRRAIRIGVIAAIAAAAAYVAGVLVPWRPVPAQAKRHQTLMTRLTNSGKVASAAISPDGKYLVHVVREGDQQALWVQQVATGTLTRIAPPEPRYYFNLTVSADGNYVYYASAARAEPNVVDLFQIPLLGGAARRVAADIEFSFTISPDGQRAAFRRFNAFDREHRLTIATIDTGEEEIVLRRRYPQYLDRPAWSPDGAKIAFGGGPSRKERGIFTYDVATGEVKKHPSPDWPGLSSIAWMPDGSGLLVTVYDRESPAQIWLLAPDGAASKITSDINAYSGVTATADASIIAAVRDETDSNIWTLDLGESARPGTAALRPVTTGLGNFYGAGGVAWLSDREVIYTRIADKMPTWFAIAADGSGQPRRMIRGMNAWQPVLSPDRTKVAFVSDKGGSQEIWIADADGQNARQLTMVEPAGLPSFTPDAKSIVFVTGGAKQAAWRINVDGTGLEQLTQVPTSRALVSPDGKWLLCRMRSRQPNVPLWRTALVPLDRSGPPRFFEVPAYGGEVFLQWHPDGKSFSFLDAKDGIANVWLQDVDGGPPRQATFFESGEIFSFGWSRDGRKLVLSRGEPTSDAVLIRNFR